MNRRLAILPQQFSPCAAGLPLHSRFLTAKPGLRFKGSVSFANTVMDSLPHGNLKLGNLSMEDWSSRAMTFFMSVSQVAMAFWYRQNPLEALGRNTLNFSTKTVLKFFSKDKFNQIANHFILPKQPMPSLSHQSFVEKLGHFISHPLETGKRFVNALRPEENYLKILDEAGLDLTKFKDMKGFKKATLSAPEELFQIAKKNIIWNEMELNEQRMLQIFKQKLLKASQQTMASLVKEPILKKLKMVNHVIGGILAGRLLSWTFYTLTIGLLTGILLQLIVFKVFVPLDKRFFPEAKAKKNKSKHKVNSVSYLSPNNIAKAPQFYRSQPMPIIPMNPGVYLPYGVSPHAFNGRMLP